MCDDIDDDDDGDGDDDDDDDDDDDVGGRYSPSMEGGEFMFHQRLHRDYIAATGLS
jgi:hypothetical protein